MLSRVLLIALVTFAIVVGASRLPWIWALLTLFWVAAGLTLLSRFVRFEDGALRASSQNWSGTPVAVIQSFLIMSFCYAAVCAAHRLARRRDRRGS